MTKFIIYKHTCTITGMSYVGRATIYDKMSVNDAMMHRWNGHCYAAINYNSQYEFHKAICEYGQENFKHEIIEDNICCSKQELNNKEKFWIKQFNCVTPNGYNMNNGGGGTIKHTKSSIELMKKAQIGKKQSQETINKRIPKLRGKRSIEFCKKMHDVSVNKPKSQQHKQSLKIAQQKRFKDNPVSQVTRDKHKKNAIKYVVIQYDKNMNFVAKYESIKEAYDQTKICYTSIIQCCKGNYKYAGGYIWKYASET